MRLHENKEGDELQRLRARRQGTGRNYKNRPRQTKTVDHTYDEIITKKKITTMNMRKEPDPNGLEVPFENDNRRSAGVSHRYSEYSNQSRGKEKPATVIAHLELQEMWKLLHHQAKRVKPAETILVNIQKAEKGKMASYSFKPFSGALCIWRLVFPSQSYGILEYCGIWCRQP